MHEHIKKAKKHMVHKRPMGRLGRYILLVLTLCLVSTLLIAINELLWIGKSGQYYAATVTVGEEINVSDLRFVLQDRSPVTSVYISSCNLAVAPSNRSVLHKSTDWFPIDADKRNLCAWGGINSIHYQFLLSDGTIFDLDETKSGTAYNDAYDIKLSNSTTSVIDIPEDAVSARLIYFNRFASFRTILQGIKYSLKNILTRGDNLYDAFTFLHESLDYFHKLDERPIYINYGLFPQTEAKAEKYEFHLGALEKLSTVAVTQNGIFVNGQFQHILPKELSEGYSVSISTTGRCDAFYTPSRERERADRHLRD